MSPSSSSLDGIAADALPQTRQQTPARGTSATRLESRATQWAVLAFVAAAISTALIMAGSRLPLAGADSVGDLAARIAGGLAAVAFAASFLIEDRRGFAPWRRRLPILKRAVDLLAMTAAMAMLSFLLVTAVAQLFQLGFIGLTIDPLGGGVLSGAAVAVFVYVAALAGARVTSEGLATLAALLLFIGTMASMLSSPDESWWQLHFSQLGNSGGTTGYRFNLSLILTGLVVAVLANYIAHDIERGLVARKTPSPRLVALLAWLFAGIGICMTIAGVVPDAVSIVIHVGAASGMVVLFGVFLFCALRYLPDLPRDFSIVSLLVVAGILVSIALWVPIGYYNLTGMEFIAAGLLFGWLVLFVRTAAVYAEPGAPTRRHARATA